MKPQTPGAPSLALSSSDDAKERATRVEYQEP